MRLWVWVAVLLAGWSGTARVRAQGSVPGGDEPEKVVAVPEGADGNLEGTVFCSDTRKPARSAVVFLSGYQAAVGLDGHYDFGQVEPGAYRFSVDFHGYRLDAALGDIGKDGKPAVSTVTSDLRFVTVRPGEATHYDVMMVRGLSLSGRVLYSDGAPAVNASIVVETPDQPGEGRASPKFQGARTDADGRFHVEGLRAGRYRVGAAPVLSSPQVAFLDSGYNSKRAVTLYSPGTARRDEASVYEGKLGDEIDGIAITIPLTRLHVVRGKVAGLQGEPANAGEVTLTDTASDTLLLRAPVEPNGGFEFADVPNGTYRVDSSEVYFTRTAETNGAPAVYEEKPVRVQAFANGKTSVVVKDGDVPDVMLLSPKIPMPAKENEGAP